MNKVILIGRLGKDPELSYTQSGTARCRVSLATTDTYKDRNGDKKEDTEWHNLVIWGSRGETFVKYLSKGSYVVIEGKIVTRSWDDNDGQRRYMTEIVVQQFEFGPKTDGNSGGGRGRGNGDNGHQNRSQGHQNRSQGRQNDNQGQDRGGQEGGGGQNGHDDIPF